MERPTKATLDETLLPTGSSVEYKKTWNQFSEWATQNQLPDVNDLPGPSYACFKGYFEYLQVEKKFKGTSISSTFAKLNTMHKIMFGKTLQEVHAGLGTNLLL